MPAPQVGVRLEVVADAEPDRIAELASALRRELIRLDATEEVAAVSVGEAPPGSRAIEALAVGALVVKIVREAGAVAAVVRTIQQWAGRGGRTVILEVDGDKIEVTGASSEQQDRLISSWIERRGAG